MKYDVDYFIKKFQAIPKEKWIKGGLNDYPGTGNHCVLGHCGVTMMYPGMGLAEEVKALIVLFGGELDIIYEGMQMGPEFGAVYQINDRVGSDAKTNVMNYLKKLKAKQEVEKRELELT